MLALGIAKGFPAVVTVPLPERVAELTLDRVSPEWETQRFSGLRSLRIVASPPAKAPNIVQLIDMIRSAPGLRILSFAGQDLEMPPNLEVGLSMRAEPPVSLPILDELHLDHLSHYPISLLLPHVAVHPKSIIRIAVSWDLDNEANQKILNFVAERVEALDASWSTRISITQHPDSFHLCGIDDTFELSVYEANVFHPPYPSTRLQTEVAVQVTRRMLQSLSPQLRGMITEVVIGSFVDRDILQVVCDHLDVLRLDLFGFILKVLSEESSTTRIWLFPKLHELMLNSFSQNNGPSLLNILKTRALASSGSDSSKSDGMVCRIKRDTILHGIIQRHIAQELANYVDQLVISRGSIAIVGTVAD
ncbi:hypothetical protein FRB99_007636 [Tulasnella sp. 403]|nr:hypothetical protein FRB99_007636 [Tulasnella sp. 403]